MAYDRIDEHDATEEIRDAVAAMRLERPEESIDEDRAYTERNSVGNDLPVAS